MTAFALALKLGDRWKLSSVRYLFLVLISFFLAPLFCAYRIFTVAESFQLIHDLFALV
jgi:hypothetical protein